MIDGVIWACTRKDAAVYRRSPQSTRLLRARASRECGSKGHVATVILNRVCLPHAEPYSKRLVVSLAHVQRLCKTFGDDDDANVSTTSILYFPLLFQWPPWVESQKKMYQKTKTHLTFRSVGTVTHRPSPGGQTRHKPLVNWDFHDAPTASPRPLGAGAVKYYTHTHSFTHKCLHFS